MNFRIAIDIGGTFTDLVSQDSEGGLKNYKALTTPDNLVDGVFNVLKVTAGAYNILVEQLLSQCTSFACGSTAGTNAILEKRGAKTGFICTSGFRDTLLIREGGKRDTHNMYVNYPEPYVPRYLTLEVTERINSEGGIEIPLSSNNLTLSNP